MDERTLRIGKNEALFRTINERVESINESFAVVAGTMTVVCECGDQRCLKHIELTRDEYERLRSDPARFAVKPGHEAPDVEDVVERHDRYWVIKKHGAAPEDLAQELDGRSD